MKVGVSEAGKMSVVEKRRLRQLQFDMKVANEMQYGLMMVARDERQ